MLTCQGRLWFIKGTLYADAYAVLYKSDYFGRFLGTRLPLVWILMHFITNDAPRFSPVSFIVGIVGLRQCLSPLCDRNAARSRMQQLKWNNNVLFHTGSMLQNFTNPSMHKHKIQTAADQSMGGHRNRANYTYQTGRVRNRSLPPKHPSHQTKLKTGPCCVARLSESLWYGHSIPLCVHCVCLIESCLIRAV